MMLLKICDPDYQTPALAEFSMGFALMSIISTNTRASSRCGILVFFIDRLPS